MQPCFQSIYACRSAGFLWFELAVQVPFISMQIGLIYTVSTLLPWMEITNTALLVGHEIKLPSRICVAPEGKLLQATRLSAVFSLPPKLLTETFRQRKRYIWLQLHITRSIETQMLMAELNNKQLGINVKIRKSILNTHISQIP